MIKIIVTRILLSIYLRMQKVWWRNKEISLYYTGLRGWQGVRNDVLSRKKVLERM